MYRMLWVIGCMLISMPLYAAEVQTLSKFSHSWDGEPLKYPDGKLEITAAHITVHAGESLPWHCHPVPLLGYIVSGGTLKVETQQGESHLFEVGDVINEVVETWHRGINISDKPVVIVVFYLGEKQVTNTQLYKKGILKCGMK